MNPFRTQSAATEADPSPARSTAARRRRSRGQVIVIFAGAMLAFMGLMAIVIDVSWYWANTLRVQRAADAAALAGVVWLPAQYSAANTTALAEAKKNGYVPGSGTTIATVQDLQNDRRLIVTVSTSIPSFFARVIGIQSFPISRTSKAEFILPVAMGSPENYYGNFGTIRDATMTGPAQSDTSWDAPTAVTAASKCSPNCNWTSTNTLFNKTTANGTFSSSTTANGSQQAWGGWNFGVPSGATVVGLEVRLVAKLDSGTVGPNCTIGVQVNPNGGSTWYPTLATTAVTGSLGLTTNTYTFGSQSTTSPFVTHTWVPADFGSSTTTGFMARLTWNKGSCAAGRFARVDTLNVRVTYTQIQTSAPANLEQRAPGTPCANGLTDCKNPDGVALNPHGFWGTMNTEGAANVNGDAYQPYYDTNTSTIAPACPSSQRACYDPFNYYNYAIEMPYNSSGGYVWIFDPGFCATATGSGTGDRFFDTSTANGHTPNYTPISSWYELFDTKGTPYNLLDDAPAITNSGNRFVNLAGYDTTMNGSNTTAPGGTQDCRRKNTLYGNGTDYHDSWYLLNPSNPLVGPSTFGATTLYRLHTTSSNPINLTDHTQRGANGEQSFSIYVQATGGANPPNVYGMGAMQAFTPLELPATTTFSEFYLANVPQAHAGKTLEISLWDPGDTGTLRANLSIEIPTPTGWTDTGLTWTAAKGTSNTQAQNCSTAQQTGPYINTNVGGNHPNGTTGVYNGCWLTIDIPIPAGYQADQGGWWKIKYNMSDTGVSNDVTTWTAKIRGNPVHLVLP